MEMVREDLLDGIKQMAHIYIRTTPLRLIVGRFTLLPLWIGGTIQYQNNGGSGSIVHMGTPSHVTSVPKYYYLDSIFCANDVLITFQFTFTDRELVA